MSLYRLLLPALLVLMIAAAPIYAQSNLGPDFSESGTPPQYLPSYDGGGCYDNDNRHRRNCNENHNGNDNDGEKVGYFPSAIVVEPVEPPKQVFSMSGLTVPLTPTCMTWQLPDGSCFTAQELATPIDAKAPTTVIIRNGPSQDSGQLGERPPGWKSTILLVRDNWAYVFDPTTNNYGWIYISDLSLLGLRL